MIYFCYIEDEGHDIKSFCNHLDKFLDKNPFSYQGDIYHIKSPGPSLKTEDAGELGVKNLNLIERQINDVDELYEEIIEKNYNLYIIDLRIEPLMNEADVDNNLFHKGINYFLKFIKKEKFSSKNNLPGIKLFNKVIKEVKDRNPTPVVAALSHYASLKTDEMIKMGRQMASEYGNSVPIYFKGQKTGIADGYYELLSRMKEQSENYKLDPSDLTPESLKNIENILSFPTHETLMPFVKHTGDYLELLNNNFDKSIAENILQIKNQTIEELEKCRKSWINLDEERFSVSGKTFLIKLNYINDLGKVMDCVNLDSLNKYKVKLSELDIENINESNESVFLTELYNASQNLTNNFLKPILKIKDMVRTSSNKIFKMAVEELIRKKSDKIINLIDNTNGERYVVFYRNSDLLTEEGNFNMLLEEIISNYCTPPVEVKIEVKSKNNNCLFGIFIGSNFPVRPEELFKDESKDDTIIVKKIVGPHAALVVSTGLSDKVRCMEFEKMPPGLSKDDLIKESLAEKGKNTFFALFFKAQKVS